MPDLFGGDFGWVAEPEAAAVATVSPVGATKAATKKPAENCGVEAPPATQVADIATVASWRAGVETLMASRPPANFTPQAWKILVADAQMLLRTWGKDFADLGWTTLEVFGVNRSPAHRRLDIPGVLTFLRGNMVEAIDRDTALIRVNANDTHTFHRRMVAAGGVPVWNWMEIAR